MKQPLDLSKFKPPGVFTQEPPPRISLLCERCLKSKSIIKGYEVINSKIMLCGYCKTETHFRLLKYTKRHNRNYRIDLIID